MDSFVGFELIGSSKTVRRKRSNPFRRPPDESESLPDNGDSPSLSSTPPSVSVSKASSDDNAAHGSTYGRKEHIMNQYSSRASFSNLTDAETALDASGRFGELSEAYINGNGECRDMGLDFKMSSEDNLLEANGKSISRQSRVVSDGPGNENKLKKVKLKVGGVTHTIHAKTTSDGSSLAGSSSTKSSHSSYAPHAGNKLIVRGKPDDDHSRNMKQSGLRGVPWKDFSKTGFGVGKFDSSRQRIPEERVSIKQSDNYDPARKSKRVQKRRLLSGTLDDEDDDDDEIRYLEKLKSSKSVAKCGADYEDEDELGSRKHRPISRVLDRNIDGYDMDLRDYNSSRSGKESKKLRSERALEDTDYMEEESVSDTDPAPKKKKERKELTDASGDSRQEMAVTTRRRALLAGRGISSGSIASLVEFPNGLPPAPPKKQKEQLTEVEQQLKRAEALQRRRMQTEKAARESEAEAIRKILGQDSSRKKREEKIKKRQEELVQERTTTSLTPASNAVRWVMGPSGTVVTFPDEMGLPCIFEQKSCSYPPPREKCAGPSCTNAYKYRDSKSKLPLCSLQCYKAIHENMPSLAAR